MQAGSKSGLTRALEELSTLLPKALECCTGTENSQNSPIVEKLRSVLLELIHGCLTCNAGKHIVAVLRILQLVLEKLPATFAEGAHRAALVHVVLLLHKLPEHQEAVAEQLLAVLCSLSNLLAEQDQPLLGELHAGTIDLLLDLEQVLFALSVSQPHQLASVQLSLYPNLLDAAKQSASAVGAAQGASQAQQHLLEATAQPVTVEITDARTWEAFAHLAVRLLVHQLQESPTLLGACTPAAVLVPALGQLLSYGTAALQESCLGLMALLVLQQPQHADMVSAAFSHTVWLVECAAQGHLPAELLRLGSMQALAACVSACMAALHQLGLLGLYCERLLKAVGSALVNPFTQPFSQLWLSLVQQALSLSLMHAGAVALVLPLRIASIASGTGPAADAAAASGVDRQGVGGSGGHLEPGVLLDVWQRIGLWLAAADTREVVQQQLLALSPSLRPPVRQPRSQASGDVSGSPAKKKRRKQGGPDGPQKKYKQMQFTVTEGGFVSSQRPGKGSGSSSSQPSDPTAPPLAAAATGPQAALTALQQLLQLEAPRPGAAAAARLAALIASLGPDTSIPAELLPALGVRGLPLADRLSAQPAAGGAGNVQDGQAVAATAVQGKERLEMLLLLLEGLTTISVQSPALIASLAQQVVAHLSTAAAMPELLPVLQQALLLALVATVTSIAAEPRSVDVHVRVWQHAQDHLQGSNNIFSSTAAAGGPPGLSAAAAVAWLVATRLMGWSGSSALTTASTQVQQACSSCDSVSSSAAGLLLLTPLSLVQHMQYNDRQQAFLPAGLATRQQAAIGAALDKGPGTEDSKNVLQAAQQQAQQVVLDAVMQGCKTSGACADTPAGQMSALLAVSQLLQLFSCGTSATGVATVLQDASQRILQVCSGDCASSHADSGTPREAAGDTLRLLGPFLAPNLDMVQHSATGMGPAVPCHVLPQLQGLSAVLDPALKAVDQPKLQCAALQLLTAYLQAASTSSLLDGAQQQLQDALGLLTARDSLVRDAALALSQQYLQPAVLEAACGHVQLEADVAATATQAAADGEEPGTVLATMPQRRLLQHLQELLDGCGSRAGAPAAAAGAGTGSETVVAKSAIMRAVAGLFEGLVGIGAEEVPLLMLLQQVNDVNAQVAAVALELLHHLAAHHTSSKELEELLLEGPAGAALLTAVGRSLHTSPLLFQAVAELCKLDDCQLAEAVAPYTVQWLCQQQLKEPLEMLASKLGQAPSTLLLGVADAVIARMLWFSLDSLERFTEFVESVMQPETFIKVVTVCGRRIVRRVVHLAGLPCFWEGQYQPPATLLTRAREYVGILAGIMELPQPSGTISLLEGEPMALLLKSIGNALAKVQDDGRDGVDAPQQRQGQQSRAKAAQGGGGQLSGVAAEKLQGLRVLMVLMHLLGEHLGRHALQLMAVLSESLVYCTQGQLRMQALSAWLCFVQLLARHAPEVLERIAAQAAVVLLPVLEPADTQGNPAAAAGAAGVAAAGGGADAGDQGGQEELDQAAVQLAAQVLHSIVVQHRELVRAALQNMPPLPSLAVLKDVNAVLIQEQGREGPLQQLQLLMHSLRHDSIAVRHVALGEVRSFLSQQKGFISDTLSGLLSCSKRPALRGCGTNQPPAASAAPAAATAARKDGRSSNVKLPPVQCQDLLSELLACLMASCENLGKNSLAASMKQRCAQCLGLLGAIDPSRVQPELPRPSPFKYDAQAFLVSLVQDQLVRVLQTASDITQLEMTSYALQQILQQFTPKEMQQTALTMKGHCSTSGAATAAAAAALKVADEHDPAAVGGLYSLLDARTQSIVAPFLTTRFTQTAAKVGDVGVVFGSHHHTFRRWLYLWLKQLASFVTGPLAAAFEACRGVTYWDQPLMLYLLPFMLVEAAGQGGDGLEMAAQEIHAVMQCAASGQQSPESCVFISDIELYLQCIFTQLDLLQQWVQQQQVLSERAAEQAALQQQQQQKAAGGSKGSSSSTPEAHLPTFVANVAALVAVVPIQTMAQAALKCGAYARALQYFETFVRQQHGGGLNPSAFAGGCSSYEYEEVSFLLEVYGHLEEPDGIAGLAQLRQGGLTSTDQILVAEKAGAWSEALALYEQALSQEAAAAATAASAATGGSNEPAAPAVPGGAVGSRVGVMQPAAKRIGAAAADVLISAACAVVSGGPAQAAQGLQHSLSTWAGLEQLQTAAAGAARGPGAAVAAAAAAAAQDSVGALWGLGQGCVSELQVGHLRCLLQMGHQQTLLRQVDGLMARCLGKAAAAAAAAVPIVSGHAAASGGEGASGGGLLQDVQWSIGQLAALGVAAAWRLGAWEQLRGYLSVLESAGSSAAGVLRPLSAADRWECCMGAILEAAERGSHQEVLGGLYNARAGMLGLLPAIAGESYSRAYPDLLKLHMLQELEDAWALHRSSPSGPSRYQRTKGLRWKERLEIVSPLLSSCEPLLALRRQLAGLMKDADGMGRCWLQHAKLCRATGHQEAAETSVLEAQARGVPGALLERCRLLWDRDKGHRAMLELQLTLQQQLEAAPSGDAALQHQHAKEMLQLTEWMAAVGQGDKEMLCEHYRESIMLDSNWERAHFAFAQYLDQLYTDAKQREGKPAPAKGLDRLGGRSRIRVDEDNPYLYLSEALKHYGESVRLGHKAILQSLPRLLTLYFEFGSKLAASKTIHQRMRTAHTQVSGVMRSLIRSIPTYKWLLVLPQLTSRMCHAHPDVQEFMQELLVAIVEQFPHQALWSMAIVVKSTIRARQEAATAVLQSAKRRSLEFKGLFENFQRLTDQLIKTCMWQPPAERRMNRCSAKKEFSRLFNMLPVEVQMPVQALFSVDLPPGGKLPAGHRPVCNQTTIATLKDEVIIMNSLQKPKKITFIGSDGLEYPFLAKPKDDLRKDYRLMDFAGTTNALLARTPGARRRGLALRTYAVLPLTDDCGILQWVNNLVPFKVACEEIYTKEKMYKRQKTPMQIKLMYDNFQGQHRAQLLDSVLKLLPPRMAKWMLGKFTDPGTWLAARLAFTRTNAAWAMVGHVLGLGDRHGENIMIDGLTGETVHVDFGCLFDHGLTLAVPERVPFRLTQNVIDCFGVSGVEGTFRRAAEMTLQVLRDNRPTLMTCAETFLNDPLVEWSSAKRAGSTTAQAGGVEAENPQAKDALHVMEGRLSGTLLGVLSTPSLPLSCEGQAARLIDEAADHENLGRMYIWWMAWM